MWNPVYASPMATTFSLFVQRPPRMKICTHQLIVDPFPCSSEAATNSNPTFSRALQLPLSYMGKKKKKENGVTVQAIVKRNPKRSKYTSPPSPKGDGLLYVEVDSSGADTWKLEPVIGLLNNGAVGVIPTDTVYAIVCDVKNHAAVERLHRIKGMAAQKPLSILCRSFRYIDTYTTGFPRANSQGQTNIFRVARQCLPGPYTFILPASKELPKQCVKYGTPRAKYSSRKCVGVRMPDDPICQAILEKLDGPLLSSSVRRPIDDEWMIDPAVIADIYGASMGWEGVDFVVDGDVRVADPSTVVDMTGSEPILLRRGKGVVYDWMITEDNEATD